MRLTACFAVALLASAQAHAVPVRGLYEASVPVPDQSAPARDPALRQAFEQVLIRVTGLRPLAPQAAELLPRASVLMQGYGYEATGTGKERVLKLRARFDARAVEAALRSQGLPVWGANRLSSVVWIALRDDGQPRAILDGAGVAARAGRVLATAEERGLPFAFPAPDATERKMVAFNEVWSGNFFGVQGASGKYNTDLIVVARVGRDGARWIGRWTLLNTAGTGEDWTLSHDTLEAALAAGVHELADRLGQRFATQTGSAHELALAVTGVDSLRDYGRVLNYLRGLNPVRSAQVESAAAGTLTVRLRVEGDPETLARVIAAGNVLRRGEEGVFSSAKNYVLVH